MIVRAFENWARFEDNGIWQEHPHIYSTILFTCVMSNARAKVKDDIIFIISTSDVAYKIKLDMYTPEQQDNIIDNLYTILE